MLANGSKMIKGLQRTTLVDYPGKIACTIFIAGCNFRCGYCYNSDLVLRGKALPDIPEEEIFDFLSQRDLFLEGVCISGGEPTLYRNLIPLIRKIKKMGYSVKLDTNGTNPRILKALLDEKLVDYVAMDIKTSLGSYKKVTYVNCAMGNVRESIRLLKSSGIDYEFRTTIVPDMIGKDELRGICEEIKGAKNYFIQQFKPDGKAMDKKYGKMEPLPLKTLQDFKDMASEYVQNAGIRA